MLFRSEKYKNKYEQESSKEVLKLANFATERSKSSFGDNLSLINPEEVNIIKQKGEKMASNERIEYYESIIEALICKRQRTKKSCEKRIAEFEQILRLLEAEIRMVASTGDQREQYRIKVCQMEMSVFKIIQNNVSLSTFLCLLLYKYYVSSFMD